MAAMSTVSSSPLGDFYNIDPARLEALLAVTRNMGTGNMGAET